MRRAQRAVAVLGVVCLISAVVGFGKHQVSDTRLALVAGSAMIVDGVEQVARTTLT